MRSLLPVIDGIESVQEYEKYRKVIVSSLKPHGMIEKMLVDQIISDMWMIKRLDQYEISFLNESTKKEDKVQEWWQRASKQLKCDIPSYKNVEEIHKKEVLAIEGMSQIKSFLNNEGIEWSRKAVTLTIWSLARGVKVSLEVVTSKESGYVIPGQNKIYPYGNDEAIYEYWTPNRVIECLKYLNNKERPRLSDEDFLAKGIRRQEKKAAICLKAKIEIEKKRKEQKDKNVLMIGPHLNKIRALREEKAELSAHIIKTYNTLETIQAKRTPASTPVITVSRPLLSGDDLFL